MVLLMLCVAGTAMASQTGSQGPLPPKVTVIPEQGTPEFRIGDTIADPNVVGLGTYTGTTVGYVHDYDEVCPYSGSLAPDVVYAYTCAPGVASVTADLCYSSYDTKIFVYDNAWTPGAPLACNDDYYFAAPCYTYSSYVAFPTVAGHTYYVVIDGYGSQSGNYSLTLADGGTPPPTGACCSAAGGCTVTTEALCVGTWQGENTVCSPNPCPPPQPVPCPAGALLEGEPLCQDNYVDSYNGGCNSTPYAWYEVAPQAGGCYTMCGQTCTFLMGASSYRDTDWFLSTGWAVGLVTAQLTPAFDCMLAIMYGPDCANLQYVYALGTAYATTTVSYTLGECEDVGVFVAASVFSGYPAEVNYVLNVCGLDCVPPPPPGACCNAAGLCIMMDTPALCQFVGGTWMGEGVPCDPNPCGNTPTETKSWGAVKNLYR